MLNFFFLCTVLLLANKAIADQLINDENPLQMPSPGDYGLRVLSPALLELSLITTKQPDPSPVTEWNFVNARGQLSPPAATDFVVTAGTKTIAVKSVGYKRRPLYAPLKVYDLRINNFLYLELAAPVPEGQIIQVKNPNGKLWKANKNFSAKCDSRRWSPVIHVNHEGYMPNYPKKAMIGYYLGSLGEMNVQPSLGFRLIDAKSGAVVFTNTLVSRKDVGYTFIPVPYQAVLEADFTTFKTPGEYRLEVPTLGASFPFLIDEGIAALFTRTYALGLYHQRCGMANELPFTRFIHGACHTQPAEVPTMAFETVNAVLANVSGNFAGNLRHTAPQLQNVRASLYPFVNTNKVNVSGGHHDAGDYSKYTINVAQLIHALVFSADAFPGAGELDNLGLPESGDGKSDLLQEAKWEADFLAKLQDADGGFYFLVYPRDREYEDNVSLQNKDLGDPQVVYPKNTSATAAAVAALAQTASSPLFKKQFPEAAAMYLAKAKKGWDFLERAFAKFGRDGSYQKMTHYGDESMHDDEIAWAATELFLATGDPRFQKELIDHFDPTKPETKRWTWWRMFEGYGCAIRSYAFAARTKRLPKEKLDERFFSLCENEIIASADDHVRYADQNAYGTSFPIENKRFRTGGWYFSVDRAFDLAVAYQLDHPKFNDPRPKYLETILGNINYEAGCNPVNISFLSGVGWKRPREMVNHYAQNDRCVLPPTGLIWGNIQEGFAYIENYKKELGVLTFPSDGDGKNAYPFYDRWGDSFNTSAEFVTVNVARGLGCLSFLMGQTALKNQSWKSESAQITGLSEKMEANKPVNVQIKAASLDLSRGRTVWESRGREPLILSSQQTFNFVPSKESTQWLEAETVLPDGRRVFAMTNFPVSVENKK